MSSGSLHWFDWALIIAGHLTGGIAALHALFTKRDPRSAFSWMVVCFIFPFVGALLYVLFGLNRIAVVTKNWESRGLWDVQHEEAHLKELKDSEVNPEIFKRPAYKSLVTSGDNIFGRSLVAGNRVEPLYDGTEAYPAMLAAIESAKDSVYLQTYIFGTKGWGGKFIDALDLAHKRGVKVRALVDGVGGLYSFPTAIHVLKKRGVKAEAFLPVFRHYHTIHLNLRNHRKILVIDGKLGFTGGMNIHDDNVAKAGKEPGIRDIHFKVEGPIVGVLQDVFLKDWYFATRETIETVVYYDNAFKGAMLCRGIAAGPNQTYSQLQNMLAAAFSSAEKHIRIMTPYFLLGYSLGALAIAAALRGVKVEVVLPEANNLSFVKGASESTFPQLLHHGIEIYYHPGAFDHSKVFIVDDFCVFLGSANLDIRSRLLNFEFNLEVHDQNLAGKLIDHFDQIKSLSRRVTTEWLQSRGIKVKLHNALFRLFSLYL